MQNWQMRDEFKVVVVKNKIYNNKLGETSINAQRSPPQMQVFQMFMKNILLLRWVEDPPYYFSHQNTRI